MTRIRVATRKSALAMTQTNWVIAELSRLNPSFTFEVVPIVTKGDKIIDVALSKVGGKGLFVSEIEQALLDERADIAVHSMKDVPAVLASGLVLAGIPKREDARDALITKKHMQFRELPQNAVVGTSSLRRIAQIKARRPDLQIVPMRGNIDTRLRKLESGEVDALILAAAGLHRMGWNERISEYLNVSICLPAIGQGVLGVECRANDGIVTALLREFTDDVTERCALAERTLLKEMNGSCQVPIAGYATILDDESIHLRGLVASVDGTRVVEAEGIGKVPEELGRQVALRLKDNGANEILSSTEGA
jgi:hydroxymethylbilane synthase